MTTKVDSYTLSPSDEPEVYRFLEWRPRGWRRQPYLTGRRMTVANLVYGMRANKRTAEEAARDYDLPLEQVQEALLYYQRHPDIIQQDQEWVQINLGIERADAV